MGKRDLSDLASGIIKAVDRRIRVAVVGRVRSFVASASKATVQPSVSEQRMIDGEIVTVPPAEVPGVPVLFQGGAKRGHTFGLDAGDDVVLVVRHRSHDEVDGGTNALPVDPKASRRMNMSDAVALPGFVPKGVGRDSSQYREDGQHVFYMEGGESVHVGSSTAALLLARADRVDAQLAEIRDILQTWTVAPSDGGLALKTAAIAAWSASPPASVASSRVKVDE